MSVETDEESFARYGAELAEALDRDLGPWIERCVTALSPESAHAATQAAEAATTEAVSRLRELLAIDIDEQHDTPLAIVRAVVRYPTAVLREADVEPVARDDYTRERLPDDDYDLTPTSFVDISTDLADRSLAWGAAKAYLHKQRHASRA